MFKIGDFSKFTLVSVKMLRNYDEIGLLKPAHVDPETGYRYYLAEQLPRLNRIIALKELGFTLEQIANLLNDDLSSEQIKGMLKLRRAEIEQNLRTQERRLAQVEARLWQIEQEHSRPSYDVILRGVRPQRMATIRAFVPDNEKSITDLFEELEAYITSHKARAIASPILIYHDAEYRETDLDVEVAIPVLNGIPGNERVVIKDLPGGLMACVVYTGNYNKASEVLNTLLQWLSLHGYTIGGALREVYLRFGASQELHLPEAFLTDNPSAYVTEFQLPVIKES